MCLKVAKATIPVSIGYIGGVVESLNQTIQSMDNRCYLSRICLSISEINKDEGALAASALVGFSAATVLTAAGLSSFCMEGVVRSFIEVKNDKRRIVRLRPLGDVGGWTSLALFSLIAVKELFDGIIKQGEFIETRRVCRQWIEANEQLFRENPEFYSKLYQKVNDQLEALNNRTFFSKNIVSTRLAALDIFPEAPDGHSSFHADKKLELIYRRINSKLEKKTGRMNYLNRLGEAKKVILQKDRSTQLVCLIFGIVIPIIMLLNVFFSLVGEFGLGKELYVDRKELTDVGHFGEWPINAIEAFSAAYLLHKWYVTDEGDLSITKKVYRKQLMNLQNDPVLHNRLAKTGNQDMSLVIASCKYFKHPIEYKFESL